MVIFIFYIEQFSLGDGFVKWVKVLYTQPMAAVITVGLRSTNVMVQRGSRQGCPLSPFLCSGIWTSSTVVPNLFWLVTLFWHHTFLAAPKTFFRIRIYNKQFLKQWIMKNKLLQHLKLATVKIWKMESITVLLFQLQFVMSFMLCYFLM